MSEVQKVQTHRCCMYICMYDYILYRIYSRIHKDIDTSDNRDRLKSQRHVLVQAAVTTQL